MHDGYIRLGDPTTSGGKVVEASGFPSNGLNVAYENDKAMCPAHGIVAIVGGYSGWMMGGRRVATEMLSKLECGCGLISTCREFLYRSVETHQSGTAGSFGAYAAQGNPASDRPSKRVTRIFWSYGSGEVQVSDASRYSPDLILHIETAGYQRGEVVQVLLEAEGGGEITPGTRSIPLQATVDAGGKARITNPFGGDSLLLHVAERADA